MCCFNSIYWPMFAELYAPPPPFVSKNGENKHTQSTLILSCSRTLVVLQCLFRYCLSRNGFIFTLWPYIHYRYRSSRWYYILYPWTECMLSMNWVYAIRELSVCYPWTECMLSMNCVCYPWTECMLSMNWVYAIHELSVRYPWTECMLSMNSVYAIHELSVRYPWTECMLSMNWVYAIHELSICQPWTEYMLSVWRHNMLI